MLRTEIADAVGAYVRKKDSMLRSALALIMVVTSVTVSYAQCAFEYPTKAKKIQVSLVQAYLGCGPPYMPGSPDTSTDEGIPACSPPLSFYDSAGGSSVGGWTWDLRRSSGQVVYKTVSSFPPNALNPPSNSADIIIAAKLSGVTSDPFFPASGTGTVVTRLRATLNDRTIGDATTVDFTLNVDLAVEGGKGKVKTSFDAVMNGLASPKPGLPRCASLQLLSTTMVDPNGTTFATAGLFLP